VSSLNRIIERNLTLRSPFTVTVIAILFEERFDTGLKLLDCGAASSLCHD
jgi:hypothetical protein